MPVLGLLTRYLFPVNFGAYATLPVWSSQLTWLTECVITYQTYYKRLHAQWRNDTDPRHTSCSVSLDKFSNVVATMSCYADYDTGRNCFPGLKKIISESGENKDAVKRALRLARELSLITLVREGHKLTLRHRQRAYGAGSRLHSLANTYALTTPTLTLNPSEVVELRKQLFAPLPKLCFGKAFNSVMESIVKKTATRAKADSATRRALKKKKLGSKKRRKTSSPSKNAFNFATEALKDPQLPWLEEWGMTRFALARVLEKPLMEGGALDWLIQAFKKTRLTSTPASEVNNPSRLVRAIIKYYTPAVHQEYLATLANEPDAYALYQYERAEDRKHALFLQQLDNIITHPARLDDILEDPKPPTGWTPTQPDAEMSAEEIRAAILASLNESNGSQSL